MNSAATTIKTFIERLHCHESSGYLVVWTRQDRKTTCFDLASPTALQEIAEYCACRAESVDVYAAIGLQARAPGPGERGSEAGVRSVAALWADIDVAGPAHSCRDLPPTEEEALSLVNRIDLPPSIVVHSGHGLQVYWRFKKPFVIQSEEDRATIKSLSRRFQALLHRRARERGWRLDTTSDLCRVLRAPGTFNWKLPDDVRLVTAEYSDQEHDLDDFRNLLGSIEDSVPKPRAAVAKKRFTLAKITPILNACAWMRHCEQDAATLSEPEWRYMLTVVGRCEDAVEHAHRLSAPYSGYSARETDAKLRAVTKDGVAPVTCRYIASHLHGEQYCSLCPLRNTVNSPIALGVGDEQNSEQESDWAVIDAVAPNSSLRDEQRGEDKGTAGVDRTEKLTELGNAKRFAAKYSGQVRYCAVYRTWFIWDGRRWAEDKKLEVYTLAATLVRLMDAAAKRIKDSARRERFLKHLAQSESHQAITAMLNLAKADERIAVTPDQFDRDPWLLTVENGTLDLKSGRLRPHDPSDLMTKLAPVIYDPEADCPQWKSFLNMIMDEREALVQFLQRAFGSCLTGITSDKALFIPYGPSGDNGKSTMVDVIQTALGDYALRTPIETFLTRKQGTIPNDIARLKGARFVWASETDRGSRLSEALIKEMTGGDKLTARFMRAEFFEFVPEFKPWILTNHKPEVRGDPALWRRVKLIPFDVSIPLDKQKPRHEVMAMFAAELPGILNWAVDGCAQWQQKGLSAAEEVVEATKQYQSEQDTFAMFLDEECICIPNAQIGATPLYKMYKLWAGEYGETPLDHKAFAAELSERGFKKKRGSKGMIYLGIGRRPDDVAQNSAEEEPEADQATPPHGDSDEGELA